MTKKNKRIYSLDSLRGIACLVISFMWHYQHFIALDHAPFYQQISLLYDYGFLGVELFFMLSGFVMMQSYGKKIIADEISFSDYIRRRISHLYPLMFITLLVVTAGQLYNIKETGFGFVYGGTDFYHFVLNLFCIPTGYVDPFFSYNGPAWCIGIELACYIVFYLIFHLTKRDAGVRYCVTLLIVLLALAVISKPWDYPIINEQMARGMASFFMGVILNKVYQMIIRTNKEHVSSLIAAGFLGFVIVIGCTFRGEGMFDNVKILTVLGLAPSLIILIITQRQLRMIMSLRPLVALGTISLSIYMWHFPVQLFMDIISRNLSLNFDYSKPVTYAIYIGSVFIVAILSYFGIEKPIAAYLHRNQHKR